MTAINNNMQNQPAVIDSAQLDAVQKATGSANKEPVSPEVMKQMQETRELLEDIYLNYKQIPNPSKEVRSMMDEVQSKLRNLNGECVTLSDKELDRLVSAQDNFADTTFKKLLKDMDECTDFASVDCQAEKVNQELEAAHKDGRISTGDMAKMIRTAIEQAESTKSRIEMIEIKTQEENVSKCTDDKQDYANGLEDLRTAIVTAKFIDYHTKVDMIEHLNDTLKALGENTRPSPKTRRFLEDLEKKRLDQKKQMEEIRDSRIDSKKEQEVRKDEINAEIIAEGDARKNNQEILNKDILKV